MSRRLGAKRITSTKPTVKDCLEVNADSQSTVSFEIVTPEPQSRKSQRHLTGCNKRNRSPPRTREGSDDSGVHQRGIKVQKSRVRKRRQINMVEKDKISKIKPDKRQKLFSCGSLCIKGLHCGLCQTELLPFAQGVVQSALCEEVSELVGSLKQLSKRPQCPCSPLRATPWDGNSLLMVQNTLALQTLRCSLQPYKPENKKGLCSYNAIWDKAKCSVTQLLQCQSCVFGSTDCGLIMAVEVQHPMDPTLDQIWLIPSALRFCYRIRTFGPFLWSQQ